MAGRNCRLRFKRIAAAKISFMQQTVEQLLGEARALHSRGDVAGAIGQYEAATLASGHHPRVAFSFISAQVAAGRGEAALRSARQVVSHHPEHAGARLILAQVLVHLRELRSALDEIEIARRLDPATPEAPAFHGTVQGMLGEHQESEQCFREALRLHPGHPALLTNLAHALREQGRLEDAARAYSDALASERIVAAITGYADVLGRLGRVGEATAYLEKALAQSQGDADIHHALGALYFDQGRIEDAAAQHRLALEARPGFAHAAYNLGIAESELQRWEPAVAALQQAVALEPSAPENHMEYAKALHAAGRTEAALRAVEDAARLLGLDAFKLTRAHVLRLLERYDEAIAAYRDVMTSAGQGSERYWDARLHLALSLLAKGDLADGWREFAHRQDRFERGNRDARVVADPEGVFLAADVGRPRIFVDAEQGIGDQLFYFRFAACVAKKCSRLAVLVAPKLRPVLRRVGVPYDLIDEAAEAADCDKQLWLSDLPLASAGEYVEPVALRPDPKLVEEVRRVLERCGPPPYVAVTWRAGLKMIEALDTTRRYLKDVEPQAIARLLRPYESTVLVLQRGMLPMEDQIFADALGREAFDLTGYSDDLERMLALLSLLDDYVAVSNTNIHLLAGLQDARASVFVPYPPEWRWTGNAQSALWFPRLTVYREHPKDGWRAAIASLETTLATRLKPLQSGSSRSRVVPVVPERRPTRENPTPRYRELVQLYQRLHVAGDPAHGVPAESLFQGTSFAPQAHRIRSLIARTGARTILDYGSGKGSQYEWRDFELPGVGRIASMQSYLGVDAIHCYDPCFPPHSVLPQGRFDGVVASDVLEHYPEEDLEWIIAELFSYANRFVFANVANYPARKTLPNGENAHVTQRAPKFWQDLFGRAARPHPEVQWEVYVTQLSESGGFVQRRVAGRGGLQRLEQ
jgi:tetratricopeptide (TPR) repeat protein